ncbi:hypothetical protein BZA05DRAFT_330230 [Tricharina praecox]|uniref:uncharacterized protein n=1 Tax=Tricharina praecox TaxID=43433 RepID=UPI00221E40A5|nr:uncharacterized protein BZA05DRAFT_330230 [Tricharina praecox]KAI5858700.1 hypothetical protein BZA05DRAFT_330230 [Tricharina praecox]
MAAPPPAARSGKKVTAATSPSDARPATSAGESRPSQDRTRRTGRMSVSTSNASDVPVLGHVVGDDRRRSGGLNFPPVAIVQDDPANAPQTTVTPPTPTEGGSHFPPKSPVGAVVNGTNGRRSRAGSLSNTPSKLSQSIVSEGGVTQDSYNGNIPNNNNGAGGGFFQTMFSAAQNAATGLTNAIPINLANNTGIRPRSATGDSDGSKGGASTTAASVQEGAQVPEREPAIKTLGKGELNLATLGIVPDPQPTTQMDGAQASATRLSGPRSGDNAFGDGAQSVPNSAATAHGSFEMANDSPISHRTPYAEDAPMLGAGARSSAGEVTPDRNSLLLGDDEDGNYEGDRKRSGSVRSGNQTPTTKRGRGGSAASQQPSYALPVSRPTGFAVASKKRNRDFHNLFKSVPEDDYLIEDYGCALQKEILLQGRLYVSEGHICFHSNILGWVTTLVISFDEVMSVEKKSTALLFPNAIVIQTLHARHIFASFISRDSTYDLILGLWNIGHPQIVAGNGEAHLDGAPAEGDSGDEDDDEYEEETDDDLGESFTDAGDGQYEDVDNVPVISSSKGPSRKASQLPLGGGSGGGAAAAGNDGAAAGGVDFPGPKAHAPTACGDDDKHYDKILCDEVLPAPLGRIYSLLFGPASYPFISHLLTDEEKILELDMPNNAEWDDVEGKKTRKFSYVKPLAGGIGPSKTRCLITETIEFCDLEDHVSVLGSTQTPDVPSGGVFSVKTRYCLSWAEGNTTRLVCTCTVEWTGKSWIKGPIEKGASDGQIAYNKTLLMCLKREIVPKRAIAAGGKGGKGGKGRRRKDTGTGGAATRPATTTAAATPANDSWGPLEILKPIFSPITDILGPLLPANFGLVVVTILVTWIVATRLRGGGTPAAAGLARPGGSYAPDRWDDRWRHEEEGLWEWLEDRAGLDRIPSMRQQDIRQKAFEKSFRVKTAGAAMKDLQVEEALGVLKERVEMMERIMSEKKASSTAVPVAVAAEEEQLEVDKKELR